MSPNCVSDTAVSELQPIPAQSTGASLLTAGSIVLVVACLYLGREIFIPFALAVLLAFALARIVDWPRRMRLPKLVAVVIAVSCAFVVIGGVSFVVGRQLAQLASDLPAYQHSFRTSCDRCALPFRQAAGGSRFEHTS